MFPDLIVNITFSWWGDTNEH